MSDSNISNAKIVYVLYLVGIVTGGLVGVVGLVMAYINRGDGPEWLESHYRFQIRTFWIGLVYGLIGFATVIFIIGGFILVFWAIWLIIRCVKGLKFLDQEEPYPNEETWMF